MPSYPTTGGTGTAGLLSQIRDSDAQRRLQDDQERERRKMLQLQIAQMILGGVGGMNSQTQNLLSIMKQPSYSGGGGTGISGGGASLLRF